MISFEKFLKGALEPVPYLRAGQKLMLDLHSERPDLYDRIKCDHPSMPGSVASHDCFYDDSKLWGTVTWLSENW